jgi:hypothetical protein
MPSARSGRLSTQQSPVVADGYIDGGWSRDGGKDQWDYEVTFGRDLGDGPLDADMGALLGIEH